MRTISTFNEMWTALEALTDEAYIVRDINGKWFTHLRHVDVGGDGFLSSGAAKRSDHPNLAIEEAFNYYTNLPADKFLVLNAGKPERRHVRWNGFMWKDLPVPKKETQ